MQRDKTATVQVVVTNENRQQSEATITEPRSREYSGTSTYELN